MLTSHGGRVGPNAENGLKAEEGWQERLATMPEVFQVTTQESLCSKSG